MRIERRTYIYIPDLKIELPIEEARMYGEVAEVDEPPINMDEIRRIIGDFYTTYDPDLFISVVIDRLNNVAPSIIAQRIGMPVTSLGGLFRLIKKPVEILVMHPRPEWRKPFITALKAHLVAQGEKRRS